MLDDIDQHLWVLEPEHPTRSQTMRRVAVGISIFFSILNTYCIFFLFLRYNVFYLLLRVYLFSFLFVVLTVKRVSLIIELSPTFPRLVPTLKFLGSETSIAPLQEKFTINISLWCVSYASQQHHWVFVVQESVSHLVIIWHQEHISNNQRKSWVDIGSAIFEKRNEYNQWRFQFRVCYLLHLQTQR
jgi:hypothetical protein